MRCRLIIALAALGGCASTPPPKPASLAPPQRPSDDMPVIAAPVAPTGATVGGQSGYATILDVPLPDYAKTVVPDRSGEMTDWMWRDQGLSIAQARERMAALTALQGEVEALRALLAEKEAGNYADVRVEYLPDWAYVFHFKRDPEATLAKYSRNPRFKAAPARFTQAELEALIASWMKRFGAAGISAGYSINPTAGVAEIMMTVTEEEYRAIAGRAGWERVPTGVRLGFPGTLTVPPVDPRVAGRLKFFASDAKATVIQPEAGFSGRIILRDGCLRVAGRGGEEEPLAYFHRETGIGLDAENYLVLIDRYTGKPTGRVGEMFAWAGPNRIRDPMPGLDELKAVCGDGPVIHVGNPESQAAFDLRHRRRQ